MLEVNNLHAYYGKSHVLRGVNVQINPGESLPFWDAMGRSFNDMQGHSRRGRATGVDPVQG